ncbi:hypothetical protein B0T10DRAFT_457933 [Thelonectria olida]|uniref:DNA (cytosine-5)-methyltransferase 1 replication foci domain-containing protein n=1 Tax=Thelonectria olida TaxID=1576542 RepID=A0A9P8W6A7_9HYPO|nr:hypothetical protein B0T10DRAFT_457933 [Thelonectria olida]
MVRRHRRASTSSVETVDESRVQWRQEKSVLRTVPSASDSNGWPIFQLTDAVVLNKDGETMENALSVGFKGPFIIRGTLLIDTPETKQCLINMRLRHSTPIEIRQSISYSIGLAENNQPLIWVSGKAGWYEIVPSASYLQIYNKMCEAATLYYTIMSIYEVENNSAKKLKKGKRVGAIAELSPIFHKYAARIGDGSTLDEVIERCAEHALFLIPHFDQEGEFDWKTTLFHKWMTTKHGDIVEKARQQLLNPPLLPRSPSVEVAPSPLIQTLPSRTRAGSAVSSVVPPKHSSPTLEPRSSVPRQRSARSQSLAQNDDPLQETPNAQPTSINTAVASSRVSSATPAPQVSEASTPVANESQTPFQTVVQAVELAYKELASSKAGMTYSNTLNKIYLAYKFPSYRVAPGTHKVPIEEVLHYNASDLLKVLDKEKYGKFQFYSWLQEISTKEFNPISIERSSFPYTLIPRGIRAPRVPKPPAPPPAAQPGAHALRDSDGDGGSNDSDVSSRAGKLPRGRPSGKKSSLRLVTASRKRVHAALESDSELEELEPKRSHYFSEGDDMDVDSAEEDTSSPEEASESDQQPIKIIIRADKAPSTAPRGPNEAWTCEEEDCGYVVRGGDARGCQDRVRKHFQEHEQQAKRVNLAVAESRGHMPIKYAWFPPFLILVEFHASTPSPSPPLPPFPPPAIPVGKTSSPSFTPPPASKSTVSTEGSFQSHVSQFRRRPHPVSDSIGKLTRAS